MSMIILLFILLPLSLIIRTHCIRLVAGVDSSTQSVKVVIREASSGLLVRQGQAFHADKSTEVNPEQWLLSITIIYLVSWLIQVVSDESSN